MSGRWPEFFDDPDTFDPDRFDPHNPKYVCKYSGTSDKGLSI